MLVYNSCRIYNSQDGVASDTCRNLWCDSQHDTVKLHVATRDVKSAFRYCDVLVQLGTIKAW